MSPIEYPMSPRLQDTFNTELKRMADPSVDTPPALKMPLSLIEYRDEVAGFMPQPPSAFQISNFLRDLLGDDRPFDLTQKYGPGFKILPVVMPQTTEDGSHLHYFILNSNNMMAESGKLGYMDAVFPPEIIENAIAVPEDRNAPGAWDAYKKACEEKVTALLRMVRLPN